jgi:hydroxymethylglutaryl-CoA reductase
MHIESQASQDQAQSSRLTGFYKLAREEKLARLSGFAGLGADETATLSQGLDYELANTFVENAIGSYSIPLGVATNFRVNGEDVLVPMAVEESSVIAAASNAARLVYQNGGFSAVTVSELMIGQIQLLDIPVEGLENAAALILAHKEKILGLARETHPGLVARGGGAKDIEIKIHPEADFPQLVVHLLIDCCEAMGANLVNTTCERLSQHLARLTNARAGLRILSNLADRRVYRAQVQIEQDTLMTKTSSGVFEGEEVARRIVEAYRFADVDTHRACTHNKGIMNGVDPVVIATGNDWRAVEAGAHAYAARTGRYRSLTRWARVGTQLVGDIELPMQLGVVGGVTRLHPGAALSLRLMKNPDVNRLSQIICCAGLASNFSALRALVTSGIQEGHMRLHSSNLALSKSILNEKRA